MTATVWHSLVVIRELSEVSQAELARRAGVSQSYLCKLEAGTRWPGPAITGKLAAALDIPAEAIARLRVRVD